MSRRSARVAQVVSFTVLVAVATTWAVARSGDGRADLVDVPAAERSTTSRPATTAPPVDGSASTTTAVTASPTYVGIPRRISIGSLDVDAPVVSVGLEPDGSMAVPGATEAGWYRNGARPGDPEGSAVIAAHVDFNGARGVFFRLRELPVGAAVEVTDAGGVARPYVVSERLQVGKDQLPVPEVFRTTGGPVLTLITCGGAYDRRHRHYADNIVVRAVPA